MKTTFAQFNIEHRRKMYGVQMSVMYTAQNATSVSVTIYTMNDQGEKRTIKTFSTSGRQVLSQYNAKQFLTEALKSDGTIKPKKRRQICCDGGGLTSLGEECPGCEECNDLPTILERDCKKLVIYDGKDAKAIVKTGLSKNGKWDYGYDYKLLGLDTGCGGGGAMPSKDNGVFETQRDAELHTLDLIRTQFERYHSDFCRRDKRGAKHPKAVVARKVLKAIDERLFHYKSGRL